MESEEAAPPEAVEAKEAALEKMRSGDFAGGLALAVEAKRLCPGLEGADQMILVCSVHSAAADGKDWYGILGVAATADEDAVKQRCGRMELALHPDKNRFPGAAEAFQLMAEAKGVLLDYEKRRVYDSMCRARAMEAEKGGFGFSMFRNDQVSNGFAKFRNFEESINGFGRFLDCSKVLDDGGDDGVGISGFNGFAGFVNGGDFQLHKFQKSCSENGVFSRFQNCDGAQKEANGGRGRGGRGRGRGRGRSRVRGTKQNVVASEDSTSKFVDCDEVDLGLSGFQDVEKAGLQNYGGPNLDDGFSGLQDGDGAVSRPNRGRGRGSKPKDAFTEVLDGNEVVQLKRGRGRPPGSGSGRGRGRGSSKSVEIIGENERATASATLDGNGVVQLKRGRGRPRGSGRGRGRGSSKTVEVLGENAGEVGCRETKKSKKNVSGMAETQDSDENRKRATLVTPDSELLEYIDAEYNDFEQERSKTCFKAGQIWAVYDTLDAMPRFYAMIDSIPDNQNLHITWLEPLPNDEDEKKWLYHGLPACFGKFKNGYTETIQDYAVFSHLANWKRDAVFKNNYEIHPLKGETWAVFKNWDIKWDKFAGFEYEVVEIVSDYYSEFGVNVAFLGKIEGTCCVFGRKVGKGVDWEVMGVKDRLRFSHRIPSFSVVVGVDTFFELDPASLPPGFCG